MYFCLKLAKSPDSRSILNKLCAITTVINGITLSAEDVVTKSRIEGLTALHSFFTLAYQRDALRPFCDIGQSTLCDSMRYLQFIEQSLSYFNQMNAASDDSDVYPDYNIDRENWSRISDGIQQRHGGDVGLHVFLQELDLTPKSKPLQKDCVRLQTVHTAKGVEFEYVFIIGLADELFPTYFAIKNGLKSIEEERRNCFVAITRSSYLFRK
jgi:DNA helicase-2/ATP-dependent DNA helicase PcrA